ncbi:MAG: UPF0175 family protein [Candidatus Brocadiae bacterium]|nr:UPF0175 family protein [Candidatus Brocadiia bacterium]
MILEEEINALIKTGIFPDKQALYNEAIRFLFRHRPELKITSAIELYTKGNVSLSRAAEIAGLDMEAFKEELKMRGIIACLYMPDSKTMESGMKALMGK